MAAWVIRQEREGEPKDAFQTEEIEVPEPGAFEVIVRVMAAGVNFNNVWAALGKPVSRVRLRRPPGVRAPHRRLRRLRRGLEGRPRRHQLEARRRGRASTATRPPTRTSRSTASTRWPRPRRRSGATRRPGARFAQFTKVQAQQLLPKPKNLSWVESSAYGLTYFTAYRMLFNRAQDAGRPQRPDLGRRRRPRRLRLPAGQGGRRQRGRRRLLRREGRARQAARLRRLHQPQGVRRDDADRRGEPPTRRRRASRSRAPSPSRSRRSSATRPTSSSSTSARRPSRPRCSRSSRSARS